MTSFKKVYRALVVDFDGTLVDTSFNISPPVRNAIIKLIGQGYAFTIATGRPYQGIVKNICQSLNLTTPQIVSGGAEIVDPTTDGLFWHEYIPMESARKITRYFLDNNLQFTIESQGVVYGPDAAFKDLRQLNYYAISKIDLDEINIKNLKDEEEKLTTWYPDLHIIRAGIEGLPVLDITSAKANKHLAVLELSKILKINPKIMVGVGNGYNDYPLLSVCGLKVAMADAPKELKEIADLIVPDVYHDGLAILIDKFL